MASKAQLLQWFFLNCTGYPSEMVFFICFFLSRLAVLSFFTHSLPSVFYLQVENPPLCYTEPPRLTGWTGKRGFLWPKMHHKSAISTISKTLKWFKAENKHIYANQNARRFLQLLSKMPRHLFHFVKAPQSPVSTT